MKNNRILNSAVIKTAVISTLMMMCICIIFSVAPFGDGTFLTGDLNGQYINYFAQTRNAVLEANGMDYSFYKGLGGSMLGIIAYYASSPFVLFYILTNPINYGVLTTFVVCAKVVLMCTAMAYFLKAKLETNSDKIIIPALAYGFAGYVFVYMQNFMWHDVLILLPLICCGIDILLKTKKPFFYCITLGIAVFANFYIAYMVCIFAVLYFLYNILLTQGLTKKSFFKNCANFAVASLIGGLLSSVLLFPALFDIQESKGIGVSKELFLTAEFSVQSFIARLFPFGFYHGNLANDLPNVYAGIISIILLIAYFCAKNIALRAKLASGAVLLFLFFSMFSTDLMLVFHGFAQPVWFTHRHAFLFVFWVCYLGATAVVKGNFTRKTLFITGGMAAVLLLIRFLYKEPAYTQNRFIFTLFLTIFTLVGLFVYVMCKKQIIKQLSVYFLLTVLIGELLINTYYTNLEFEKYSNSGFENFVTTNAYLLSEIEKIEDGSDYRVEKNYKRSLNDSFLLNYYGISHFGSTQTTNAVAFIHGMELTNSVSGVYDSTRTNIYSDSVVGIKYLLTSPDYEIPYGYEPTGIEKDGFAVYENKYAFPLAYMLPEGVSAEDSKIPLTETFENDVYNILRNDEFGTGLYNSDWIVDLGSLQTLSDKMHEDGAEVNLMRGSITANINAKYNGLLFFSVPYSEHLIVEVNGKRAECEKVFNTQLGVPVSAGQNEIVIKYSTPMKSLGIIASAISVLALAVWYIIIYKKGAQNGNKK